MRSYRFAVLLGFLVAGTTAHATDVPKGKGESGGSASSGSGATGGSYSTAGQAGVYDTGAADERADLKWGGLLDIRKLHAGDPKPWTVGVGWETHALIRQNDLSGDAPNKLFNYGYIFGSADITRNNRVSVRFGFYQRLIADQNETGARLDDLVLSYSRRVRLPKLVTMRFIGALTIPTSFASQLSSLILAPRLTIALDRAFASHKLGTLSLDARVFTTGYIVKYASVGNNIDGGGNPNARASFGGLVDLEYALWFHQALSLGAEAFLEYLWFYDVWDPTKPAVGDAFYHTQPVQTAYGGEVYLRYQIPPIKGMKIDVKVAFADGDPTLGYNSLNHDGVSRVYGFWRHSSEIYGNVDIRY
jgi:hypothetical protein